jgi:hypothetical protein
MRNDTSHRQIEDPQLYLHPRSEQELIGLEQHFRIDVTEQPMPIF